MIRCLLLLLYCTAVDAAHFNGGTITWQPVDPYNNSSSVTMTIIQTYWWSYPTIQCANDVPITTSGRANQGSNLTCVADCSTSGGYSSAPVKTLTDCISVSSSLGMMTSQRSVNITLTAGAYFYLAYVGNAWVALGYPSNSGLQWSILTFIDLRMRPDGFINTPPVVSIVSPQFVIVNRTTQIEITVSDVNVGDDVRCRWSIYTNGYRRRRQVNEDLYHASTTVKNRKPISDKESVLIRKKRGKCPPRCTVSNCALGCLCSCPMCLGTTCSGLECTQTSCLPGTTTVDTPATLKPTSSYPVRQAIDECGGICYPSSMPNGTNLTGCTLSFTGLVPGTWYAAAIQVEDFINESSTAPMSSVPVQFLIYVMPEPACSNAPVIIPLTVCLDVTVGIPINFDLFALNLCQPNITDMADIIISKEITGITISNMTISSTNTSLAYITITWTPQANQIGPQQMCAIAYTDVQIQSTEYCVTFNVTTSLQVCVTTTTITTSSTTTSSSTTATTSTPISTTRISTTSYTTSTTLTIVTSATVATTAANDSGKGPSWGLIAGILSLALPLALCSFWCLYRLLWSPAARRRQQAEEAEEEWRYNRLFSSKESMVRIPSNMNENLRIRKPSKSYQVYNIVSKNDSINSNGSIIESESSILVSIYNNTNAKCANSVRTANNEQSFEMGNAWMQPQTHEKVVDGILSERSVTSKNCPTNKMTNFKEVNQSFNANRQLVDHARSKTLPISPFQIDHDNDFQSPLNKMPKGGQACSTSSTAFDFGDLARKYTLGNEHQTKTSHV